ncbi:MAG: alkaline phosphatase family protein [Nitrospirota bacterium]|nr:alkaline phosphatase family protein [Nitrospirota bacterium]
MKGYEYGTAKDIFELSAVSGKLSALRDECLSQLQTQTPLEYVKSSINSELGTGNSALTYDDFLRTRTQIPEIMNILPAGMQFKEIRITNEYTTIPEELKHKVRFVTASTGNRELLNRELTVMEVSNKQVIISYEPETVEDQEIINSYGSLDNTPAYLVRLRPVLKVNGERVAVGTDGLHMGSDYNLTIELYSPSVNGGAAPAETITNTMITGNLTAIGIVAGLSTKDTKGHEVETAEDILYREATNYIDRWNRSEDELASLLHLAVARPLPTVATIGGMIDVTYVLDMPHGFTWKGVYLDADLRSVEIVPGSRSSVPGEREKQFMKISSLQGSVLEHRLLEDDFKVESISTAKLIQLASAQQSALSGQYFTIDGSNINTVLPTLDVADNIKEDIRNSVYQNFVVRMPSAYNVPLTTYSYKDWTGIGYIKENPESGESGWMLSGMIAGGSTVPKEWLNNMLLMQTLSTPYTGPKNLDPLAGARVFKIPATDNQPAKTVNEPLEKPLAVAVVDRSGNPVTKAKVTFEIKAGGGEIQCLDENGNPIGLPSKSTCYTQTSSTYGIAQAQLRLGKLTADNPVYRILETAPTGTVYPAQLGQNIINASATSYSGTLYLDRPFEQYGKPDMPAQILKVSGNGNKAVVNTPLGTLVALVADQYGNPISNATVTFAPAASYPVPLAGTEGPSASCWSSGNCRNVTFYKKEDCAVLNPLYGECTPLSTVAVKTDYSGARVEAMAGNTVGTQYFVEASTAGVAGKEQFSLQSTGQREKATAYIASGILLSHLDAVDAGGHQVNAAKAGSKLKPPLVAKLYRFEDEVKKEGPVSCTINNQSTQCWKVTPTGAIKTTAVANATVTFTPKQGNGTTSDTVNPQPGIYLTSYTTGTVAAVNKVAADAEATVEVPEVFYDAINDRYLATYTTSTNLPTKSITMKSGQLYEFNINTGQPVLITAPGEYQTIEYTVYGVKIDLTAEPKIMLVDDQGFTTTDRTFTYTIAPPEYNALSADIDFITKDAQNLASWDGYLTCDQKQGTGVEILSEGETASVSVKHYAQVVLNWGTDLEMEGDEVQVRMAQLNVKTDDSTFTEPVDEIKFSDGKKDNKRYKLELKSADMGASCSEAASFTGSIKAILKSGVTATSPGSDFYPMQYPLSLNPPTSGCTVRVNDEPRFIVSNRSIADLTQLGTVPQHTSVLYGGLGNAELIELSDARKEVPIEPVGVIVLAIDGLRQDVLYSPTLTSGETVTASYIDPHGCGQNTSCYIQPDKLKGLCEVMGGKYSTGLFSNQCDPTGWGNKHVKIKDVTAIFPSITLASWASVFTGKLPDKTGILGNEFFARDLVAKGVTVPEVMQNPAGIVSFSSGAFNGYDALPHAQKPTRKFFIPYQADWKVPVDPLTDPATGISTWTTPQNRDIILTTPTVYEDLNQKLPVLNQYFSRRGGDPVVVANNHYARGGYWLTWDLNIKFNLFPLSLDESTSLDAQSWDKLDDYLYGKYTEIVDDNLVRNKTPFSALTVWYLPGPDHEAHAKGMTAYKKYVTSTVDEYIGKVVATLKEIEEFDNKIFIVVADHGHTAMPEKFKYKLPVKTFDAADTPIDVVIELDAEPACRLNLDFGTADEPDAKAMKAEQANNNLHIWELGEVMRQTGFLKGTEGLNFAVMAPQEIANLYEQFTYGAKSNVETANVIAALNGPMSHIYVKNRITTSWNDPRLVEDIGHVAELLRLTISNNKAPSNLVNLFPVGMFEKAVPIMAGMKLLMNSVDMILVRRGNSYEVFHGIKSDGSDIISTALDNYPELSTSRYVKAAMRINGMNHPSRSGDIVLIFKSFTNDIPENRYTSGVACKSWHGSLNPSDSNVPVIVAYPGGNTHEMNKIMKSVSACPNGQCEGNWNVTGIIKEIIKTVYVSQ